MNRLVLKIFALFVGAVSVAQAQIIRDNAFEVPQEDSLAYATKYIRGDKLRGYKVSMISAKAYQVNLIDTITLGTYDLLAPEHRSLGVSYLGNVNSPWQSKLFFDRSRERNDFVYSDVFQGMYYTPDNVLFYDTKSPLTFIRYQKNFRSNNQEEVLDGTFSSNFGRKVNIGANFGYVGAKGFYNSNKSRDARYRVFGSFRSNRYDLFAYVANDYYLISENGGITEPDYISNPEKYTNGRIRVESKDIPVLISTDILFNRLRSGHAFLAHRFNLGYTRTIPREIPKQEKQLGNAKVKQDSLTLQDSTIFVPVGSISHTFYYNKQSRRFISRSQNELWEKVFSSISGEPAVYNSYTDDTGVVHRYVLPNDTAMLTSMQNTVALSLNEGFRPWVKAGLSAYARLENYWVSNPDRETGLYKDTDKFYSAFLGGELSRYTGRGLNFRFRGEVGLLGKDLGAMRLDGDIQTNFTLANRQFGLELDAFLENRRPAYFAMHNHGTYGWWDENFDFSRRVELGAKVKLDSWKTWAEVRTASLQNYVYWGADARTHQQKDLVQVIMLKAGHQGHTGILNWSVAGAWQQVTNESILPLPHFLTNADLWLQFMVAGVMQVQLGMSGYWHTSYYAPYYMPTVQQFIPQSSARVGGSSPLLTAFADFRIRESRFFLKMFNIGEAFMDPSRMSAYLYPYNPMHLSAGVVIDLDN